MTDVALSVAVVTAATGIIAASVPQVASMVSDARQARRDQRASQAKDLRQACLDILGATGDLRTRVDNAAQVHGDEMAARLAEIRSAAAAVQLHAVGVALLAPGELAGPGQALADAAARLALATAGSTDKVAQELLCPPQFTELDDAAAAFREAAVAHASGAA